MSHTPRRRYPQKFCGDSTSLPLQSRSNVIVLSSLKLPWYVRFCLLFEFSSFYSRTKNMMWYGMLATREFALKTYKNLGQRIRLECDGQHIPLPRLQGIVVLNIPSFMGGSNFWGGKSGNHTFMAPSYNDKVLEVVAVYGTMQLGMAMVVPEGVLQSHRIAQCRSITITILG